MNVAQTILAQLGGNRFIAMTGAKSFGASGNALTFRLPSRFAKDGINAVRVTLDATDTYTVTFMAVRGIKVREVATDAMVYCSELRRTFTGRTGLHCSL
jgi:hypothetical protein